ncbi:unnamed protein product [Dicrocoelium dendriticum]|nr:unnamed protein product [Dicrocoelium dendriticum]
MGTLRKFVDHILPASNQTKEKNLDALDALDHSWGSSVPEPIDYELYLAKHRTSIANDPHRDILLFPSDDLKLTRLPCPHRIANAGAPPEALQPGAFADNPLGRHSVSFLANTEWICIHQSSALYRGSYCKLPRTE